MACKATELKDNASKIITDLEENTVLGCDSELNDISEGDEDRVCYEVKCRKQLTMKLPPPRQEKYEYYCQI